MEHVDFIGNIEKIKSKVESDVYFKDDFKRCIKSSFMIDGIIKKELTKIHTEELQKTYTLLVFTSFCKQCGLFDVKKEDFLTWCSEVYDIENGIKEYIKHE